MTVVECPICYAHVRADHAVDHAEWHRELRVILSYAHGVYPAHDKEIRDL